MPKLTMPYLKLLYNLARKRTKKKNICVCKGERMSDTEFEKVMGIVNQLKNK